MKRYVIIGTGPAAVSAAEVIRKHDVKGDIVLIGDEGFGYYSRPGLAYYLTGELPENGLYPYTEGEFKKRRIDVRHGLVTKIIPKSHQVILNIGNGLPYDRLLIATGARAFQPKIPGGDLHGVVKLDNLDDARKILKLTGRYRTGIVIGGGITALELVEGLRARGVRTHYFLRRDRYWSNVLDEVESGIVENRLIEEGVKIHYQTELSRIMGKRGRVVGVITKDGHNIKCKIVAVAIGIRPRKELADEIGLMTDRGILVDENMRTSFEDIYAAGDVAQVYDPQMGKNVLDSLWGPARNQGYVAGLNMAGINTPYKKDIAFNVTRLAGLTTTIIGTVGRGDDKDLMGIARGDSETWRQLPDAISSQSNFDVNRVRLMVGKETLLGAIVMGDQKLSQPIHHLISKQVNITSIREALLRPIIDIPNIILDFWSRWRVQDAAK